MRAILLSLYLFVALGFSACGGGSTPATPVETLKAYTIAMKSKDTTMMKLLLSEASIKVHQQEATARGVTLDEIVQQQTLFPLDQRVFDYRNEKIEGEKATVEVRNSFGGWDTVFLVKEGGAWKIDRKGSTDQMIQDVERDAELLDKEINEGRINVEESPLPEGSASPAVDASPSPLASPGADTKPTGSDLPPAQVN